MLEAVCERQGASNGGICRGESGSIRAAEYFNAELVCGNPHQIVTVEVTQGALCELEERLGAKKPEGFQETNALVCEMIRDWMVRLRTSENVNLITRGAGAP
jgi:hypothetical protein